MFIDGEYLDHSFATEPEPLSVLAQIAIDGDTHGCEPWTRNANTQETSMMGTGPLKIDRVLAKRAESVLNSGAGLGGTIAFLRQQGENKMGTIRVLASITSLDLGEIKRRVHLSETWQDRLANDNDLHTSLLQAVTDLDLETERVHLERTSVTLSR